MSAGSPRACAGTAAVTLLAIAAFFCLVATTPAPAVAIAAAAPSQTIGEHE